MPGLSKRFPYLIRQDVIWRDMDAYQHVNNAIYFRYFEDVRMSFFADAGIVEHKNRTQIGPILASTRCDFRAPLTYPDRIQIGTAIEDLRPKRFTMHYAVYSEQLAVVAAEGEGVLVYYDYRELRSCEIPQAIRDKLSSIQGTG